MNDTYEKLYIHLDLDGTLAVWRTDVPQSAIYVPKYFLNLPPTSLLSGVRQFIMEHTVNGKVIWKNKELIFLILSAYLEETNALWEKDMWSDTFIPEISKERKIFVPCGGKMKCKAAEEYLGRPLSKNDILIDDYSKNLTEWENEGGLAVKYLNGINGKGNVWKGKRIRTFSELFAA